jgi:hypothetical protein
METTAITVSTAGTGDLWIATPLWVAPFLIYWSVEANTSDYGETTFGQRILGIFDTLLHLPARTRWSRMLHTVH